MTRSSRPLLRPSIIPVINDTASSRLENLTQSLPRHLAAREVNRDQPRADKVDNMMQGIGISDTVNGSVNGNDEEEGGRDVASPRGDARDHLSAGQCFDEDEVGHYG